MHRACTLHARCWLPASACKPARQHARRTAPTPAPTRASAMHKHARMHSVCEGSRLRWQLVTGAAAQTRAHAPNARQRRRTVVEAQQGAGRALDGLGKLLALVTIGVVLVDGKEVELRPGGRGGRVGPVRCGAPRGRLARTVRASGCSARWPAGSVPPAALDPMAIARARCALLPVRSRLCLCLCLHAGPARMLHPAAYPKPGTCVPATRRHVGARGVPGRPRLVPGPSRQWGVARFRQSALTHTRVESGALDSRSRTMPIVSLNGRDQACDTCRCQKTGQPRTTSSPATGHGGQAQQERHA